MWRARDEPLKRPFQTGPPPPPPKPTSVRWRQANAAFCSSSLGWFRLSHWAACSATSGAGGSNQLEQAEVKCPISLSRRAGSRSSSTSGEQLPQLGTTADAEASLNLFPALGHVLTGPSRGRHLRGHGMGGHHGLAVASAGRSAVLLGKMVVLMRAGAVVSLVRLRVGASHWRH